MTLAYLAYKNLTRNPLRTTLTAIAVALPMTIFVFSIGIVQAIEASLNSAAKQQRLLTQHKVTFTNLIPDSHRREIEDLDPTHDPATNTPGELIVAVMNMRWFGGKVGDVNYPIQGLAMDPDTFPVAYSDISVSDAGKDRWANDRTAAIVHSKIARFFNWEVGTKFTMKGSVPPFAEMNFTVAEITDNRDYEDCVFVRKDYLTEVYKAMGFRNSVGTNLILVKSTSLKNMDKLAAMIDANFKNTPDETKTQDEASFNRQFLEGFGNLPLILQIVGLVVVVVIGLAAANTMSMVFRERIRELAALKAMGFPRGKIAGLVLGESLALSLMAGTIGAAIPFLIFNAGTMQAVVDQMEANELQARAEFAAANPGAPERKDPAVDPVLFSVAGLKIPAESYLTALAVSAIIGIIAGIVPAIQAWNLNTIRGLKYLA